MAYKYEEINVNEELLREAYGKGMFLDEYLETLDPSHQYSGALAELDALERQMLRYGLYTKSGKGYRATELSVLNDDITNRILFTEYLIRQARMAPLAAASKYDIDSLLALTRFVTGNAIRHLKVDLSSLKAKSKSKIAPAAEIPRVKVDYSEEAVSLSKSGVAIEFSYEFLRRASMDLMSVIMGAISIFDREATFNYLVGLMYNGAVNENVGVYDGSLAAGEYISYTAYLKWLNSFDVFTPNVILADINSALKIVMMQRPNIAPADVMALLAQAKAENTPYIANGGNIAKTPAIYIVDDGVLPADTIVGVDTNFAFERVIEVGSNIDEYVRFVTKQTEVFTSTVNEGFLPIFAEARKALVIKVA